MVNVYYSANTMIEMRGERLNQQIENHFPINLCTQKRDDSHTQRIFEIYNLTRQSQCVE
jgi:hypothetical protein